MLTELAVRLIVHIVDRAALFQHREVSAPEFEGRLARLTTEWSLLRYQLASLEQSLRRIGPEATPEECQRLVYELQERIATFVAARNLLQEAQQ